MTPVEGPVEDFMEKADAEEDKTQSHKNGMPWEGSEKRFVEGDWDENAEKDSEETDSKEKKLEIFTGRHDDGIIDGKLLKF